MLVGLVLPMAPKDGDAATWAGLLGLARTAEAGGADSLWAFDHLVYRLAGEAEGGMHEVFTILAAVAASTQRVAIGPLVTATSFRNPGLLAKIAAGLDLVAPRRVILGMGCGWHEPEYQAFGYPFDHRVGRFEEALAIVRPLLDGERVTRAGTWQSVDDAVLLPPPANRVPIVVAAKGSRMLALTAQWADGWQTTWFGLPDDRFRDGRAQLLDASGAAGRATPPEVYAAVQVQADPSLRKRIPLDAGAVADALAAWAEEGVAHVQLWVDPATVPAFETTLEGIRRWRG
ncbi:MAG: LLM class flavin-dependent oxidoreductase [Chloroflexota bacterium]